MKNLLQGFIFIMLVVLISCKERSKQDNKVGSQNLNESENANYSSHCKPKTTDNDWYSSGKKAPKFQGLKGIDFKITTRKKEAQEYFNQGMMLSYGFNHAEAARSFFEASRIDSTSAMCYWGYAYVLGPNYNAGMEEDNFERAFNAAQKAKSLSGNCSEKEKQLIHALSFRYEKNPPKDRSPLNISYSHEMKKVYEKFPSDPDIGALYAESLMDLHPWDLYEKKTKQPKAWTPEIISVLEHLIKINPMHPGAHHFYIHAVEASTEPEKGLKSAKLLATLVPGSGHLVHMPSHIYINTGHYHLGTLANLEAVKVDSNYITACHAQGAYPLAYYPHNYHFLAATATLEGNSKLAWFAAKKVLENTAEDIMIEPGWGTLQHYYTIPYYVAVKFAMWDTILAQVMPPKNLIYPQGVLHYARGMAYAGKNNMTKAEIELSRLKIISKNSILESLTIWDINSTAELMHIAVNVLSAEIFQKKNQHEKAIVLLREAVAIEDNLNYNEPPDWFFSVRHHLGAALIDAGKFAEAEKVYNSDLKVIRENGWALRGLMNIYEKLGDKKKHVVTKSRFEAAWKHADTKLISSSIR